MCKEIVNLTLKNEMHYERKSVLDTPFKEIIQNNPFYLITLCWNKCHGVLYINFRQQYTLWESTRTIQLVLNVYYV